MGGEKEAKGDMKFRLKVQQIEQVCLFELSWGQGQQLSATVSYPATLNALFQNWQQVYLQFYKTASMAIAPSPAHDTHESLRGRAAESGGISSAPVDWHARLVEAEAKLLYEFHRWLRSGELFEIRAQIAKASQAEGRSESLQDHSVQLFLTCTPLSLARLPWEAWEIGTEFAASGKIRIVRSPTNIRAATSSQTRSPRSRARILAILGDDTGLNFQTDKASVQALSRIAEIRFIGWQPEQSAAELKQQIGDAIADETGWDVLFFAGHSNESDITGGELAIAPGVSMTIHELAPKLTIAKERGLQFAIFNSCSGLNIAESLIDLGLSQVAVMREPIHNRVAEEFLLQFLQTLAAHKDAQEALLAACQFLKLEKNVTYPSAYLIPSLFSHPSAIPFRIQPSGWKQQLQQWMPTKVEAIALIVFLTLAWMPQVQDFLLGQRLLIQSRYRELTAQLPPSGPPPVALVQIDDKSIRLSGMSQPRPIDRSYLASLVSQLSSLNAKVVGIDYLLDRQQAGNDPILGHAVREAVKQRNTWFVFGALYTSGGEVSVGEATGIADRNWSLQGYINSDAGQMMLPEPTDDCIQDCPFAYLLSMVKTANRVLPAANLPQPQLTNSTDLRTQLVNQVNTVQQNDLERLERSRFSPLTVWAETNLKQTWLHPIIDFSIPPDRVYDRIAAWGLLDTRFTSNFSHVSNQIVIIAPGGYSEAGVDQRSDNFPLPPAMAYWRSQTRSLTSDSETPLNASKYADDLAGAESHAYMIYQLLNHRVVVPIPDLWLIGVVAILGKGTYLMLKRQPNQRQWLDKHRFKAIGWLAGGTLLYGLLGLQLYISAAVLLPWLLPSAMAWVYVFSVFKRRSHAAN
jgi:hypothetical protein